MLKHNDLHLDETGIKAERTSIRTCTKPRLNIVHFSQMQWQKEFVILLYIMFVLQRRDD